MTRPTPEAEDAALSQVRISDSEAPPQSDAKSDDQDEERSEGAQKRLRGGSGLEGLRDLS